MFTHPALLRQINVTADFLRACGETVWARKLLAEAERIRKKGWTEKSKRDFLFFLRQTPSIFDLFLVERGKKVFKTEKEANSMLSEYRQKLLDLCSFPTREEPQAKQARKRSPDLP